MILRRRFQVGGFVLGVALACCPAAQSQETPGRGAVPPQNLQALAARQAEVARVQSLLLRSGPRITVERPACSAQAAKFNWAEFGKVSAIQNQGGCGSCWAFASNAAYESSYLIENGLSYQSPANVDSSEQEALDCASPAYSCQGGWHDKVFDYFVGSGETTRGAYSTPPYTAKKHQCKNVLSPQYHANKWDYVKGDTIPSKDELKQALCEHGPLVAAVSAKNWDKRLPNSPIYAYSTENPNWQTAFPNTVFRGTPSRPGLTMESLQAGDVDHDVLIVGWDDTIGAWIIKNSWGSRWGDAGSIKLAYDNNNIGFNAAWVEASQLQAPLSSELSEAIRSVNRNFKIDLQP